MPSDPKPSKLCLGCARRKLAGKPFKPCGDCVLINVDPMAKTRANAARPAPLMAYAPTAQAFSSLFGGTSNRPAKRTSNGGRFR